MRLLLTVTILLLTLGCTKSQPAPQAAAAPPPAEKKSALDNVSNDVLTPGGVYTQADIDANGGISPFEKYADVLADPNAMHTAPAVGDYACPVTGSKGVITWQIAGKVYSYCCPPCILDHVRKAKKDASVLKDPEEYKITEATAAPAEGHG